MDLDAWALAIIANKTVLYVASFLSAGSALFLIALHPDNPSARRSTRRLGLIAASLAVVTSLSATALQAGYLLDDGLSGMIDGEMLALSADGPLGFSVLVRVAGIALVAIALLFPRVQAAFGIPGALLVAASFTLVGHSVAEPRWLLAALITVHLLAISFWIGALAPLYAMAKGADLVSAADTSERFGPQAMLIVPLLILAGSAFILLRISPLYALTATAYGFTLLAKLAIVAALLSLAALNKLRYVPQMARNDEPAAASLRRSIRLEALAFLAIFAVTATLTTATTIPSAAP